jgi:GAF domain-containing protein
VHCAPCVEQHHIERLYRRTRRISHIDQQPSGPGHQKCIPFKAAEERATRLAVLNELSRKIAQNLDLKEIIESIARAAAELTQADKSRVFLFDEATETFDLSASFGQIPDEGKLSFKLGQGLIGTVGQTGKAIIVPDIQTDSRWINVEWSQKYDMHSYIALPIHIHGKPVLTINCFSHTVNFFGDEDLELLGAFASQAAIAIEKSRLINDTREHAMRQEVTARIAKTIGSTLEPEALFRLIVGEIRRAVPCDRCTFSVIDVSKKTLRNRSIESDVEVENRVSPEFIDWIIQNVYLPKKLEIIPDLRDIGSNWVSERTKYGLLSLIVIPIILNDECIAHLSLTSTKPGAFSVGDEKLLTAIAGHLGPASKTHGFMKNRKKKGGAWRHWSEPPTD